MSRVCDRCGELVEELTAGICESCTKELREKWEAEKEEERRPPHVVPNPERYE